MNHRIGRVLFALFVGLAVAVVSFKWITDPAPRAERAREEQVVQMSRSLLASVVESDSLEIVDPLAPNRKVGKVYVFAETPGWAVSGYYRRSDGDRWHPYLMNLTETLELDRLKVQDEALAEPAAADPRLEISQ
ncbi:MAG: hypothetical protein KJO01_12950 [Gammaproteobacteria bacterium]|nr:hypothetical protein [Gammaproteobacteria bacterium]MBT8111071.1 hypothetical protein [Gammaproteobacteria bacterium]NND47988.1 hypothetical protein [Woeseiaceae bacterium]NNL45769.1 hypothetical protein [Woeseiaceae bacterium]